MKAVDVDKERAEKEISMDDFLTFYNKNLPSQFPKASNALLKEFKREHPLLFKDDNTVWTLDRHRKKFMDWHPKKLRVSEISAP